MSDVEPNERFWTDKAIAALARRFGLDVNPYSQDWPWEVADPRRLQDYVDAYDSGELTEDEKFVLMDMILQAAEEQKDPLDANPIYARILQRLEQNFDLHRQQMTYWARLDSELEDAFSESPSLRRLLADDARDERLGDSTREDYGS